VPWTILLQILHQPPQNLLLILLPLKSHMIAIDPENTTPTLLHTRILQSELHIGESLVDFLEQVAGDLAVGGVPAACWGVSEGVCTLVYSLPRFSVVFFF
jgi:hypothetical protein